jgi:uncharacterized protein
MEAIMGALHRAKWIRRPSHWCEVVSTAAAILSGIVSAQAQQPQSAHEARVVVIGEGSVTVPPDYAQLRVGATTRGKTAKDAAAANNKLMNEITIAALNAGIAQEDIQTSRYSVQPIYAVPQSGAEQKLAGFSVANDVEVKIRQIDKVGGVLDQLVTAGATDIGNIEFRHSELSKVLDGARDAAVADARRKAELYAHVANLALGNVAWITEDSGFAPPPVAPMRATAGSIAAPPPISGGEDALHVRITVAFSVVP